MVENLVTYIEHWRHKLNFLTVPEALPFPFSDKTLPEQRRSGAHKYIQTAQQLLRTNQQTAESLIKIKIKDEN